MDSTEPRTILMVTPYPPQRDGIAAYAVQSVRALRAAGHRVDVLSPGPSAAHHHLDLVGPRGALALAKRVRDYDRLIVQFHPDYFYPQPLGARELISESLALATAFRRAKEVEVVVHEIDTRHGRRTSPAGRATRRLWRSVDRIVVHTDREREDFIRAFGVRPSAVVVTDHGADFVRHTTFDRAGARRTLGIDPDEFVFLSIGFVQRHKGFDRAVRAFAGLPEDRPGARLDIVGSVRTGEPAFVEYRDELAALVGDTKGVRMHEGFVSDERFDRWLVAADVVVLPYRQIWSSGVLERARLYDLPVIATRVGGLAEQVGDHPDVTLVSTDTELRQAMRAAAGLAVAALASRPWPTDGGDLRTELQREVVARAAEARGSRLAASARTGTRAAVAASTASAPLRRVSALELPEPVSNRALAGLAKRTVRRLTQWEVEPLVKQVNALRAAAVEAVEQAAVRTPVDPVTGTGNGTGHANGNTSKPNQENGH